MEKTVKRALTPYMKGDKSKQEVLLNNPKDKVYTPDELAKEIITKIDNKFNISGTILDPCKGKGAFYNNYPNKLQKDYCEIDEGKDFLELDESNHYDFIISNPPYSCYNLFHDKAMKICDNIVWLIPINKLSSSGKRVADLAKWGGVPYILLCTGSESKFPFGFSVGAVYYKKGYKGPIEIDYSENFKKMYKI